MEPANEDKLPPHEDVHVAEISHACHKVKKSNKRDTTSATNLYTTNTATADTRTKEVGTTTPTTTEGTTTAMQIITTTAMMTRSHTPE